uniref:XK-related protein n=1 Tax=Glossina palpalis gambiensis TaxID=67801 RepID=A0A1B0C7X4_9MUSC
MEVDNHIKPPHKILGYTIRSRTRIYVSFIIPRVLELLIFIVEIVADSAVSYQHFKVRQLAFAWSTLILIWTPPLVTFLIITRSEGYRKESQQSLWKFLSLQLLKLLVFPVFMIYNICVKLFWSVEALFQNDNDEERMLCLSKTEATCISELYHLIQAYGQSAPQIILQLYHLLTQDMFRNYETTTVQAISLIFSSFNLAAITTTYQRFASQKQVGRPYPWATKASAEKTQRTLRKNQYLRQELLRKKRNSERTIHIFPESERILENFNRNREENLAGVHNVNDDVVDSKVYSSSNTHTANAIFSFENILEDGEHAPEELAPSVPSKTTAHDMTDPSKLFSRSLSQMETYKNMLILNAQLYIHDTIPRPPKLLTKDLNESQHHEEPPNPVNELTLISRDEVDFFLPHSTLLLNGVEHEDFAAKTIAFFGWIAFIIMRMLALSTFCVFYPKDFLIIIFVHYLVILIALLLEARAEKKVNLFSFCFLLAYIYIYVILEFRLKFKHLRFWLIGYCILTVTENVVMTIVWYRCEEFESWWFYFICETIIYSGILFTASVLIYYCILKPKDIVVLLEDNGNS